MQQSPENGEMLGWRELGQVSLRKGNSEGADPQSGRGEARQAKVGGREFQQVQGSGAAGRPVDWSVSVRANGGDRASPFPSHPITGRHRD